MTITASVDCAYNAPLIAVPTENIHSDKHYRLIQSNCHHWDCPRCGNMMARLHYGNIVHGAKYLSRKHIMYFFTITSKGSDISLKDAQSNYYLYTNRLLSAMRYQSKIADSMWSYVQVTERQKRGHPHSHFLMTFVAKDLTVKKHYKYVTIDGKRKRQYYDTLRSEWITKSLTRNGLGVQYHIEEIDCVEAMAKYLAKYLFKDAMRTQWPDKWKRVRYSRNWRKIEGKDTGNGFPILHYKDWQRLKRAATMIMIPAGNESLYERALAALYHTNVEINYKPAENTE